MLSKRIDMFVLKVSRGQFDIEKLRIRFCGCTVTLKDDGNTTLIMVDGLKVKLNVDAELRFVETCRIPPSPQPHGGQVQSQQRGPAQPQQRVHTQPQQKGPAQPQQRVHAQPQHRSPASRIPVHVAPPLARGGQVPVTHVAHGGESEHSIRRDGNRVRGGESAPIMLTQGAWKCPKSHVPDTNENGFEWCPRTGGWKC